MLATISSVLKLFDEPVLPALGVNVTLVWSALIDHQATWDGVAIHEAGEAMQHTSALLFVIGGKFA